MAERRTYLPDGLREALQASAEERDLVAELRAELERIRTAAVRASAELRHAYRPETRDWNLVARSITILERATTPGREALEAQHAFACPLVRAAGPCTCATCTADGPSGVLPLGGAA